jgi:large subunit ribosomal protein L17
MRHHYFGKQLSRNTDERKRLIRNLSNSLITVGMITTSKAKAFAIRASVEKLITKAKKNTEVSRRQILADLGDRRIVDTLIEMSKVRFSSRNSGYTRITKIGPRRGDATEMVILSFVDEEVKTEVIKPETAKKEKTEKKAEKKVEEAPKKKAKTTKKAEK